MTGTPLESNTLYYGDCLEILRGWPERSVDLIYLDPPFNSDADYNIIFGSGKHGERKDLAQMTAFSDVWEWTPKVAARVDEIKHAVAHPAHKAIRGLAEILPGGDMLSYLVYMADRLAELHRVLKDSGSIYLHCDKTAAHYLKIIMDCIFARRHFRNEIIWFYPDTPGRPHTDFPRKHDSIFRYAKSSEWTFNADAVRVPIQSDSVERYKTPRTLGGRQYTGGKAADAGKIPESVWRIPAVKGNSSEATGYPTQKPLPLLKRIISASSNEGDLVLDPFCGCGTTIEAASLLKRNWAGIDISSYAIEVIRRERMKDKRINIAGMPKDLEAARLMMKDDAFQFEKWAVTRIPGFAPNIVQRGDRGIDGRASIHYPGKDLQCIAQVKGGAPGLDALGRLARGIADGSAAIGVFITMQKWDTPSVREHVARAGMLEIGAASYNRLVMFSIEEYFEGGKAHLPPLAHPRTGKQLQEDILAES